MNEKKLRHLIRSDIEDHLSQNNNYIKVRQETSDSIIIENINFQMKYILFSNTHCNYKFKNKKEIILDIQKIKKIKFNNCTFYTEPIIRAKQIWLIDFEDCEFDGIENIKTNILANTNQNKKVFFKYCQFEELKFGDIRDIQYNTNIKLSFFEFRGCTINEFIIENIEIVSKFYINKQYDGNDKKCKIDRLIIHNSIFKENFKLHNCEVNEAEIKDTDFEKNADFYKSHFKSGLKDSSRKELTEIYFKALNFKELALFGDTIFDKKFHLQYVTLRGFSHFRNAKFKEGLDLDYTNTQNIMNFFGVTELDNIISKQNTSQETYRIIKYNFEQLENIVEANKYHVLELEKHREYIWSQNHVTLNLLRDGIVSLFHRVSSNHSSNWFLALFWIFMVSLFTNLYLENDIKSIECILKYINILSKLEDFNDSYTVMTFNKISLGYLYYQFLTAVRKDTRKK